MKGDEVDAMWCVVVLQTYRVLRALEKAERVEAANAVRRVFDLMTSDLPDEENEKESFDE